MSSDLTPQQEGRAWEPVFAKSIGAALVRNSGAGFAKLDVRGIRVLWSLKWAGRHKSFSFKDEYMREAHDAIHGPGGIGGEYIPGVAFKTQGDEYVVFRKNDAIAMMHDGTPIATAEAVGVINRPRRVAALLREED